MSAQLPGIGDTANPFGYVPPSSPDFIDHDDEAQDATEANIEALGEWLETSRPPPASTTAAAWSRPACSR